jgi:hypothetical protein
MVNDTFGLYDLNNQFHKLIAIYKILTKTRHYDECLVLERFDSFKIAFPLRYLESLMKSGKSVCILNLQTKSRYGFSGTIHDKQYSSVLKNNVNIVFDYKDELDKYIPDIHSIIFYMVHNKKLRLIDDSHSQYLILCDKVTQEDIKCNLTAEQLQGTYSKLKMLGVQCEPADVNTILAYDSDKDKVRIYTMQPDVDINK